MTLDEQEAMIEGYFRIRREGSLKFETSPFEGRPWEHEGESLIRRGGKHLLRVSMDESQDKDGSVIGAPELWVYVTYPDGTSKSFS